MKFVNELLKTILACRRGLYFMKVCFFEFFSHTDFNDFVLRTIQAHGQIRYFCSRRSTSWDMLARDGFQVLLMLRLAYGVCRTKSSRGSERPPLQVV